MSMEPFLQLMDEMREKLYIMGAERQHTEVENVCELWHCSPEFKSSLCSLLDGYLYLSES